jgi:catechol 2,3-dioxygenase-like lactoylglutathione lyase family enzyme
MICAGVCSAAPGDPAPNQRAAAAVAPAEGASAAVASAAVEAVDSVAMTVSDADRSIVFYTQVLQFQLESDREVAGEDYEHLFGVFGLRLRCVRLRLGDERIELLQFLTPRGRPIPPDTHANDRSFQHIAIIVSDMQAAYSRLRGFHVQYASTAPQRLPDWNPNAGGIEAFYFRDPDGHFLEILAFPSDKGPARWHARDGRLFLGIDHTAIVVADTEASLRFYRDRLGMRVVGTSENYGTEQEHLNNVFGAHLRITSLRAAAGPGVEFLEYLAPVGGRAIPGDTMPEDLWYWQINLRAGDPMALQTTLQQAHVASLSGGEVEIRKGELGYHQASIVRDPDGHANLIGKQ